MRQEMGPLQIASHSDPARRPVGRGAVHGVVGVLPAAVLAAVLAGVAVGCQRTSEIERQRDAAVAQAEREIVPVPLAGLRREPPLTVDDRARWKPVLRWPDACEEAFQASHAGDDGGIAFHRLAPGLATVSIVCAAGSYQPSQVFLRLDERGSSPIASVLAFPVYRSDDGVHVEETRDAEIAGEAVFSPDGREVSVLALSRQIGDCGIWTRYAIGSEQPRITAAAARLPCPEAPGDPAEATPGHAPSGWAPIAHPPPTTR